ncbi:MAG: ExbD/TolR family protein [Candidatus Spyradosoma sp.]
MQPKLSSPFNLRERLRNPDSRIGVVPLASVLLVAFFLFAMTSKYVFAPGLTVDLAHDGGNATEAPAQAEGFALPVLSGAPEGKITTSIITVRNESMFIFDGRIFRSVDAALPPEPRLKAGERGVLLARMDKNTSIQVLFDLAEAARDAGFSAIQIAGESAGRR